VIKKSDNLSDVDHFFPEILKGSGFLGYVDGIWNLVLACKKCNRGNNGKFTKLPTIKLLERLNKRNEYFCSSHHPLKETIMSQTGYNVDQRKYFLQKCFNDAKNKLIHTWEPLQKGISTF